MFLNLYDGELAKVKKRERKKKKIGRSGNLDD